MALHGLTAGLLATASDVHISSNVCAPGDSVETLPAFISRALVFSFVLALMFGAPVWFAGCSEHGDVVGNWLGHNKGSHLLVHPLTLKFRVVRNPLVEHIYNQRCFAEGYLL